MLCVDFSIGVHLKMNCEYSSKSEEDCDLQLVTDAVRYAQGEGCCSGCSKNSKRSIRWKTKRFVANNGDVHYKKKNGTLLRLFYLLMCIIVPLQVWCMKTMMNLK